MNDETQTPENSEENTNVETPATPEGEEGVQPMPVENVKAPFADDTEPDNDTADENDDAGGVQEVHVVDEDPERHVGREVPDPWSSDEADAEWAKNA